VHEPGQPLKQEAAAVASDGSAATAAVLSRPLGATARRDRWWLAPILTGAGLTAFGIYSIVVAAMGSDYLYTRGGARYLSPFYSPDLTGAALP
jgi:hypothetical protein